jgi:hypothetical protein
MTTYIVTKSAIKHDGTLYRIGEPIKLADVPEELQPYLLTQAQAAKEEDEPEPEPEKSTPPAKHKSEK